jgi:hypothetical protein
LADPEEVVEVPVVDEAVVVDTPVVEELVMDEPSVVVTPVESPASSRWGMTTLPDIKEGEILKPSAAIAYFQTPPKS